MFWRVNCGKGIEIKKYNISYLASKIFENVLSTVPKPPEVTE